MTHQLIVCEKPSAAQKIAYALGEGRVRRVGSRWIPAYRFERGGNTVTVVSALGHLYAVGQQSAGWSFPIFNLSWFPLYEVERKAKRTKAWIEAISKFAEGADSFVSACDYDTEGSLIAYMILKHACGGGDAKARRMKFSTLTKDDLQAAYREMMGTLDYPVAWAGMTRHELDWIFGVNVSRAMMDSYSRSGGGFEVLSAGRVQSPALYILYKRENSICLHVPDPFWVIGAEAEVSGAVLPAAYKDRAVFSKAAADAIAERCNGAIGNITSVIEKDKMIPPPVPFDLGGLQLEAYRLFGFTPSRTQKIAEKLYLGALISYPRTSSQKLPPSLNLPGILRSLARNPLYGTIVEGLMSGGGPPRPREGKKSDPAHPAIHPTGSPPVRLGREEFRVYDLIVKRFLAAFGQPAFKRVREAEIDCGNGDLFMVSGEEVTDAGWTEIYRPYSYLKESPVPDMKAGEKAKMQKVWAEQRYTQPPPRFNPSSILRLMERNGLGTKSTRAEILDTLYRRGYIQGGKIAVTELGFGVIRMLRKFFPELVSVELTRKLEGEMEEIEAGTKSAQEVMIDALDEARKVYAKIVSRYGEVGDGLSAVVGMLKESRRTIGVCPKCVGGKLIIIYSRKTGKRFIGCSNYSGGCRFTLPLPQRGKIAPSQGVCRVCGYPIVEVRGLGRRVWRLCVNVECESKSKSKSKSNGRKDVPDLREPK